MKSKLTIIIALVFFFAIGICAKAQVVDTVYALKEQDWGWQAKDPCWQQIVVKRTTDTTTCCFRLEITIPDCLDSMEIQFHTNPHDSNLNSQFIFNGTIVSHSFVQGALLFLKVRHIVLKYALVPNITKILNDVLM